MQLATILATTVTAIATAVTGRSVEVPVPLISNSASAPAAGVDSPLTHESANKLRGEDIDWGSLKLTSSDSDDTSYDRRMSFKRRLRRKQKKDQKKKLKLEQRKKKSKPSKKLKIPPFSQPSQELVDSSGDDMKELDPLEYYGRKAKEEEEDQQKQQDIDNLEYSEDDDKKENKKPPVI
ncbi:unknown protein [Seminavis robusta]|uniref:Secreted protein n=1 Tax=Seminavis robusta TaxID=568900 RepID=A0A9N8E3T5_9STRA|nr:unknown protein [Seminavis robusta]|eukprot:Sro621_g176830.1 n/a (179) ;mRNA; r:43314-43850